jgi:nicotinamide/nicotinate riboside kinase
MKDGFQDWDCAESLDLVGLKDALVWARERGEVPGWLTSKEDQNTVEPSGVEDELVARLREHVSARLAQTASPSGPRIFLLDGFLLYPPTLTPSPLPHLSIKLLLLTTLPALLERRARRTGYVTLEGFWEDPEGYVENVVWANYVRDHAFLFAAGDVEGPVREDVIEGLGVKVQPDRGWGMGEVLEWAVEVILKGLGVAGEG